MRGIWALATKDLRILARDKFGLFWVAAFPLLMALFFGSIFSSDGSTAAGSLKVGLSGVGKPEGVAAFQQELETIEVLDVRPMPLDSAKALVRQGELVAYIHYADTTDSAFGFFGPEQPAIEVGIDPSRRAEAGYLQGLVTQAYFGLVRQAMMDPGSLGPTLREQIAAFDTLRGIDPDQRRLFTGFLASLDTFLTSTYEEAPQDSAETLANAPFGDIDIEFKDVAVERVGPRSAWEITFPQSLQWALIGVAAAFAISMVVERRQGTYLRLRQAPIGHMQILLGKGTATFLACLGSCVLMLSIGVFIFGVRVTAPISLAAAVLAAAFCFVGLMMFISTLGKTEQAVGGAGWAILLVFSMTGGGMVPLMVMPSWMLAISHISPVKWSILAMEGAIWRGFGPMDMLPPIAILLGVGLVGFTVGAYILSRTDD